jgi:hypothetical protein
MAPSYGVRHANIQEWVTKQLLSPLKPRGGNLCVGIRHADTTRAFVLMSLRPYSMYLFPSYLAFIVNTLRFILHRHHCSFIIALQVAIVPEQF